MNSKTNTIVDLITLCLAITSINGAIVYRVFNLGTLGILITLVTTSVCLLIIGKILKKINPLNDTIPEVALEKIELKKYKKIEIIFSVIFLLLLTAEFIILFKSRVNESIISPWQHIHSLFFYFIFFSSVFLSGLFLIKSKLSLLFTIFFLFLINSVAIIVYKFGFGFDFFIHQATLQLIDAAGFVEPKPFYYLGQYSIIIILHKLFFIPILYLHLLLVPLLSAVLIPINLYRVLKTYRNSAIHNSFLILILSILPLGIFYNTTPQNLAFLFLILVILRCLDCKNFSDLFLIYALAFSSLLTQPIAGIPAILLAIAVTIYHSNSLKIKDHFYRLLFIVSAIALPGSFILLNNLNQVASNSNTADTETNSATSFIEKISIKLPEQENVILNTIYFFEKNLLTFLFFMLLSGFFLVFKNYREYKISKIYLYISSGFFVSYFITKSLSFDFLIDYERLDYASRIFKVALLLLIPFFIIAINFLLTSLSRKNKIIKIIFLTFFLFLIPIFVYLNYPRFDNYHNSHGYSVSQDDIDAVHWIEGDTKVPYIVLANQQTSVAALKEFGFNKYFKANQGEEIFYYPIPTGGPMYAHFLSMVNKKPDRRTMLMAMNLAGVDTGYFVISKYWWASSLIIDEAKLTANSWHSINNDKIVIFKYSR